MTQIMTRGKSPRWHTLACVWASCMGVVVGSAAPGSAAEDACTALSAALQGATDAGSSSAGFVILDSRNLYRFQDRPFARLPFGAAVKVRAPRGMSDADIHRAAECGLVLGKDGPSPLTVPGARLEVKRAGSLYELHITARDRGAARKIQERVAALRRG